MQKWWKKHGNKSYKEHIPLQKVKVETQQKKLRMETQHPLCKKSFLQSQFTY